MAFLWLFVAFYGLFCWFLMVFHMFFPGFLFILMPWHALPSFPSRPYALRAPPVAAPRRPGARKASFAAVKYLLRGPGDLKQRISLCREPFELNCAQCLSSEWSYAEVLEHSTCRRWMMWLIYVGYMTIIYIYIMRYDIYVIYTI